MKITIQGLGGLAFALIAAGCAIAEATPWITALFAIATGIDCLTLSLFGGHRD
ncbi:hypothetical protein JS531_04125 [Bifidobacterium sp. CP2]|uniref:hypothetical protein n=1 Tax=Bifidobacterium TaxID=1678 RepID=UPI001BDBECA3|nr:MULTISPECIES: hypothetical protein [Bifidobacterium]MBT1181171.1 hypothetical protein [Bifidobacterium sp. CP2]MBW3079843.1 hypothetical protein [Bifidobacterium saguinibicoloris]